MYNCLTFYSVIQRCRMFAPQIKKARPNSGAGSRGPLAQVPSTTPMGPLNGNTAQHVSAWNIGNKVAGPLYGRQASGPAESPFHPRREGTQPSRDFSRIPVFSPGREGPVQGHSPFH